MQNRAPPFATVFVSAALSSPAVRASSGDRAHVRRADVDVLSHRNWFSTAFEIDEGRTASHRCLGKHRECPRCGAAPAAARRRCARAACRKIERRRTHAADC